MIMRVEVVVTNSMLVIQVRSEKPQPLRSWTITSHHMRNLMRDYREKARAAKGQSEIKRQQKLMLHSPIPVPKHSVRRL